MGKIKINLMVNENKFGPEYFKCYKLGKFVPN